MKSLKLNPNDLAQTAKVLHRRIGQRFKKRGTKLLEISEALVEWTECLEKNLRALKKYRWLVRLASLTLILLLFAALWHVFPMLKVTNDEVTLINFVQALNALLGLMATFGVALLFITSWERRFSRRMALKKLNTLSEAAHVVKHHLENKSIHRMILKDTTDDSPDIKLTPFGLDRYFDYSRGLLGIIGSIGALYCHRINDREVRLAESLLQDIVRGCRSDIVRNIQLLHLHFPTLSEKKEKPGAEEAD